MKRGVTDWCLVALDRSVGDLVQVNHAVPQVSTPPSETYYPSLPTPNRSGLSQLKPVGVFGRTPAAAGNPTDRQLLPGQKVGKKLSWSPPRSPGRRLSGGAGGGDSGGAQTAKTGRNKSTGGSARNSEVGGETSSSSEEGEGEEEEEEEDETMRAELDAQPAGVGERVSGRENETGAKRRGVRALFRRRRLRSGNGGATDVLAAAAAAAAAATAAGAAAGAATSRQSRREDGPRALGAGGVRDRRESSYSSSSSSSSSVSSPLCLHPPAPPDVAMRTPAGIWMNRSTHRLPGGREKQHGAASTDADAHPGSPAGGAGHSGEVAGLGEGTLLEQVGAGQKRGDDSGRGGGDGKLSP